MLQGNIGLMGPVGPKVTKTHAFKHKFCNAGENNMLFLKKGDHGEQGFPGIAGPRVGTTTPLYFQQLAVMSCKYNSVVFIPCRERKDWQESRGTRWAM